MTKKPIRPILCPDNTVARLRAFLSYRHEPDGSKMRAASPETADARVEYFRFADVIALHAECCGMNFENDF